MSNRIELGDMNPQIAGGRNEGRYVRHGIVETYNPSAGEFYRYDLIGVRSGGQELCVRYAGTRSGTTLKGLPLAGPGSLHLQPVFWIEREDWHTITIFPPAV